MDFRLKDNTALLKAAETGNVVAMYIISPSDWKRHDVAPIRVDFWLRNLALLKSQLNELHIPLLILTAQHHRSVPELVVKTAQQVHAQTVAWNKEYEIHELARDKKTQGISMKLIFYL